MNTSPQPLLVGAIYDCNILQHSMAFFMYYFKIETSTISPAWHVEPSSVSGAIWRARHRQPAGGFGRTTWGLFGAPTDAEHSWDWNSYEES